MRFKDYETKTEISNDDVFIVNTSKGTKQITYENIKKSFEDSQNEVIPGSVPKDNSVFLIDSEGKTKSAGFSSVFYAANERLTDTIRGKCLGNSITPEQLLQIQNGKFKDMWLGDYWEKDGIKWRIAGFNYYKSMDKCTENDIVVIPDTINTPDNRIECSFMNEDKGSNSAYGYYYSPTLTKFMQLAIDKANHVFKNHLIKFKAPGVYGIVTDPMHGAHWAAEYPETDEDFKLIESYGHLLTEYQVYGYDRMNPYSAHGYPMRNYGYDSVIPLFTADSYFINPDTQLGKDRYWLRDWVGTSEGNYQCVIGENGLDAIAPNEKATIRPYIIVRGEDYSQGTETEYASEKAQMYAGNNTLI